MSRLKRRTAITLVLALLICLGAIPLLGGGAAGAPRRGASAATAEASRLLAQVRDATIADPSRPGAVPAWKDASVGSPLLVRGPDGKPSEYVVPVRDSSGRTISTIGVDANDNAWHWYRKEYRLPKFPLVSAEEAVSRVRSALGVPAIAASIPKPEARMGKDKVIYWRVALPKSKGVEERYVPVFSEGRVSRTMEGASTRAPAAGTQKGAAGTGGAERRSAGGRTGGAPGAYVIQDVPFHYQETNYWCGPASLEMVFDYFGPDIDQAEIAGVSDSNSDYGVYANELVRAAQFSSSSTSIQQPALKGYTGRSMGYSTAVAQWSEPNLMSGRYSDLKELVSQNYPVTILSYYDGTHSSTHFRVLKGYDDAAGSFIIDDPWYQGPGPSGPDVVMNQTYLVDDLWVYSYRWGMIAAPWAVTVNKPGSVAEGQTITVTADVTYPGPSPLNGQYSAQQPSATLELDTEKFELVSGAVTQDLSGIDRTGSTGTAAWSVRAKESTNTMGLNVYAQGKVTGRTNAYGQYADMIGGLGTQSARPLQTSRTWGHDSVGVTMPSKTWYLAEGSTNGGFETWVLVQNPGKRKSTVSFTYMTTTGPKTGPRVTLEPNTRTTVNVADSINRNWSVSTQLTATEPVIAERAMYWGGREAGHDSLGVTAPAKTWYLAEGSTNGGFETWVLVQNPGDVEADVKLTYMTDKGEVEGPGVTLEPRSRKTLYVADTVKKAWSVSTQVVSDQPVIAERAMYWGSRKGGHDSIGVTEPSMKWYLAEGSTNGGFETWVLVQNPNDSPARVALTYMTADGPVDGPVVRLAAHSRKTLDVADTVAGEWSVSTEVSSDKPVIAERAMYWNDRGEGHDSIGVAQGSLAWYLAEGCTNVGFETWVLVQNPNADEVPIAITYMTDAGPVDGPVEVLPPFSRKTYNVADTVPWTWEVSTEISSGRPVIAERAMYGDPL